jgi:hypothetical protein
MQVDSTCGYAEKEGFRCGTGNEFPVFNIINRKQLKLSERPLIVINCNLFDYQNMDCQNAFHKVRKMGQFNSDLTMLWHNSTQK